MNPRAELLAMRERVEGATEGPWKHNGNYGVHTAIGTCVAVSKRHDDTLRYDDAEFIAHARTDLPRLLDAVEKVLELHVPHEDTGKCDECTYAPYSHASVKWPCPTVQAITAALEGK